MKPEGLPNDDLVYLAFGVLLCVALVWVTIFYFSRKRKKSVEEAKYKMLDDDE